MNTRNDAVSRLGLVAVAVILGFFVGERLEILNDSRKAPVLYQSVIKGYLAVQSEAIEGACPNWPNDQITLSNPIVTDGNTRGFALGHTSIYESDLLPNEQDGFCWYSNEFEVLLSPTGKYELSFTNLADTAEKGNTFIAQPMPSRYLDGVEWRLEAHWVEWLLTTIDCPEGMDLCLRDVKE
jgi:hypothetical protein